MRKVLYQGLSLVLLGCLLVVGGRRISEIKCSEYRNRTIRYTSVIPLVLDPNPITFQSLKCTKSVDLIVGGEDAREKEFPHQALLGYRKNETNTIEFRCGGTLISERYVLTAAHCSKGGKPVLVRFAELNLLDEYDNQVDLEIESFKNHHKYTAKDKYYDIALIRLKEEVIFSDYIRPACLWTGFDINVTSFIATGFGYLADSAGVISDTLRKVQLDLLDPEECNKEYRGIFIFRDGVVENQLCVGSIREGRDTCTGDSGGPLQLVTASGECIYHVVAVTSFGGECGAGRSPSVYTRVASFIDWIEEHVWGKTTNVSKLVRGR
ncbi:serine protease snake-like [Toxorhynchites rutilus septentrionalis]|uniref:serine protease snake-like n=1 Tax=Toxorhynchites rutilus septentrionalis TaxID=329112 RepID=UPI0024798213|nr:serine protease snake-like [Toxorhynchites rutilus septentrionalis]